MDAETFNIIERSRRETSIDLAAQLRELKDNYTWDAITSTGYGRFLSQKFLGGEAATEIKAYATAAHNFHRNITTVIDLGGQDTKVLSLDSKSGQLLKFEMNDKCSAGTGKFFEMMATSLGLTLDELVDAALRGKPSFEINSTCTVFAESEVISLLTSGKSVENIARAVHESLLVKLVSLLSRVLTADTTSILFVGGGANNGTLVKLLADALSREVVVPEYPDFFGAYGAAIVAKNSLMRL
jgi:(R)-2-hydroxyacyl-CoA dehydratese activating ATPase